MREIAHGRKSEVSNGL